MTQPSTDSTMQSSPLHLTVLTDQHPQQLGHFISFERFGEAKDLGSAIQQQHEAVTSTPLESADRSGLLNNLGISYLRRFEQYARQDCLGESLSLYPGTLPLLWKLKKTVSKVTSMKRPHYERRFLPYHIREYVIRRKGRSSSYSTYPGHCVGPVDSKKYQFRSPDSWKDFWHWRKVISDICC